MKKKIKKLKDCSGNVIAYECLLCRYQFKKIEDAEQCSDKCNQMVDAYMFHNKISRKEALELFRLELL